MASRLAMMRFRDKLKSSKEKNTLAAPELAAEQTGSRSAPEEWTRGKGKGNRGCAESAQDRGNDFARFSFSKCLFCNKLNEDLLLFC
jgi:hypothetical protein